MKGKITEVAFTLFFTSLLIYIAVMLFLKIWWVLVLLIAIIATTVVLIRIYLWRFRNPW